MKRYLTLLLTSIFAVCSACYDDAGASSAGCGNGMLDSNEVCEGNSFAQGATANCGEGKMAGPTLVCNDKCEIDVEKSCVDVPKTCGNDKLDDGEACDGNAIRSGATASCPDGKMTGPTLVCNDKCEIDVEKSCVDVPKTCGNDKLDDGEACDGNAILSGAIVNCPEGKMAGPTLVCNDKCEIDVEKSCVDVPDLCGNGMLDDGEKCDGNAVLNGAVVNCGEGKMLKSLVCSDKCEIDVEKSCVDIPSTCGNGDIDEGEDCDGEKIAPDAVPECLVGQVPKAKYVCNSNTCKFNLSESCEKSCGNGKLDGVEMCEGTKFVDDASPNCLIGQVPKAKLVCSSDCQIDVEKSCEVACGNGKLDGDEVCDGNQFVENKAPKCPDSQMPKKKLVCSKTCDFDIDKSCEPICGNGEINDGEECDGETIDNNIALKCPTGQMPKSTKAVCNNECKYDLEQSCELICGNGKLDNGEDCDKTVFKNGLTFECPSGKEKTGTTVCGSNCKVDLALSCKELDCGNGRINNGEECDKTAVAPNAKPNCPTGYKAKSTPVCSASCNFDLEKSCEKLCGNGVLDDGEDCDIVGGKHTFVANFTPKCPRYENPKSKDEWVCYTNSCKIDVNESCERKCGNGKLDLDYDEECDGDIIDPKILPKCPSNSIPRTDGKFVCKSCSYDLEKSCESLCGNGVIDDGEYCDYATVSVPFYNTGWRYNENTGKTEDFEIYLGNDNIEVAIIDKELADATCKLNNPNTYYVAKPTQDPPRDKYYDSNRRDWKFNGHYYDDLIVKPAYYSRGLCTDSCKILIANDCKIPVN